MRSMTKAWPAVLAAAAFAVALPACGDDETEQMLDDAAGDVQREAKQAGRDVEDAGTNVGDKAKDAARDVDKQTGLDEDAVREGKELGSDAEREANEAAD
jgi:hypothetical protein